MSAFSAVCVFALIGVSAILSLAAALGAILIVYRGLMLVLAALPAERQCRGSGSACSTE